MRISRLTSTVRAIESRIDQSRQPAVNLTLMRWPGRFAERKDVACGYPPRDAD